jgi:hypothetical protein
MRLRLSIWQFDRESFATRIFDPGPPQIDYLILVLPTQESCRRSSRHLAVLLGAEGLDEDPPVDGLK